MEKDNNAALNLEVFYGNEEPKKFSVGDLWFCENTIYVAKKQNDNIVWVKER